MKRKFQYTLPNKEVFDFAERNREDSDFSRLQEGIKKNRFEFIQKNVTDPDNQLPLLLAEMNKIYSPVEMGAFINGNTEEKRRICFDSFKLLNPGVGRDEFNKKFSDADIASIYVLLLELERPDPISDDEIVAALGITFDQLNSWKEEQPALYKMMKDNVKKKAVT